MQKDNGQSLEIWKKNRFQPTKIEIVQYKNRPFVQFEKRPRIDLTKAVVSRNIEIELPIEDAKKQFCFEVVYDKQFVFLCKDEDTLRFWVNKLALQSNTWGVFGYPLSCAVKKSSWRFPIPVFRPLQFLFTHQGNELEGIFRTNASHLILSKIKTILDGDQDVDMESFDDCRVAAAILKDYLRQLPEPLIPFDQYKDFIELPSKVVDPKLFMENLPRMNQDTLWYLCSFLYEIQLNEEKTRMNASNLATCIGLTVCRPPPFENIDELIHTKKAIATFEFVLSNYEAIFFGIKQRNEKEGLIPPDYPCVIPHQKIPFVRLTSIIKTSIKKDSDLPHASTQVRTKAKLSKSNSETDLNEGIEKEKAQRNSEIPFIQKDDLIIEKPEEVEVEKEIEKVEGEGEGTSPKTKKERKPKGRKGSFEANINTLISKGLLKMKIDRNKPAQPSDPKELKEEKGKEKENKTIKTPRGGIIPTTLKKLSFEKEKDHKRPEHFETLDEIALKQHITEMQINIIEDLKKELIKVKEELRIVKEERDYLKKRYEPDTFDDGDDVKLGIHSHHSSFGSFIEGEIRKQEEKDCCDDLKEEIIGVGVEELPNEVVDEEKKEPAFLEKKAETTPLDSDQPSKEASTEEELKGMRLEE